MSVKMPRPAPAPAKAIAAMIWNPSPTLHSRWDALIIVAAEGANCQKLWSENLNDGQVIRGVCIENPIVSI